MMKNFTPGWRELISGGLALIVSSGILIYTMRGNMKVANYYMWFEISISSFYYIITIGWSWWLIPAFSFVFMLPVSLKHYTAELNKDEEKQNFGPDAIDTLTNAVQRLQHSEMENKLIITSQENKIKEYVAMIEEMRDEAVSSETVARLRKENADMRQVISEKTSIQQDIPQKDLANMTEGELLNLMKSDVNQIPENLL
jgi:hypothetical protein